MRRTSFLFVFAMLVGGMVLSGKVSTLQAQPKAQQPNVLFIVVDDMNCWSLLNDYPVLKVPAIKKLMSESFYFRNASCAAPVCVPSRAAFFSGKYPHHSGVYKNGPEVWNHSKLLTEVDALPELFKRSGYTTWGGGKTFHVSLGEREQQMFDNKVFHGNYGPFATGKGHWFDIKPWEGPDTDFTDVVNADAASAFLAQRHDKPFFMYYGLYRPHSPYTAPKRFYDLYEGVSFPNPPGYLKGDLNDVPEKGKALSDGLKRVMKNGQSRQENLQGYLKAYCANTSFADWNVGRVLEALDKSAYAENTIVIFISDNGFHNGTKDHWAKQTLWEQADNIPFLVRVPGSKARTCPQTVNLIDIYPTLVEYCGLAQPRQALDGKSLVPVLKDPEYKWERPGLTTFGAHYTSLRSERYRYISYPDGSHELYDHATDPYEHTNLAGQAAMKPVMEDLSRFVPTGFEKSVAVENEAVSDPAAVSAAGKRKGAKKKQKQIKRD